jgi:hypothetical protein
MDMLLICGSAFAGSVIGWAAGAWVGHKLFGPPPKKGQVMGKLKLILAWVFDWIILPVIEMFRKTPASKEDKP